MSLLVTGSIGIDTVHTPHGVSENCLGGSSVYFSMAASFFNPVRFVGVIGGDCPFDLHEVFAHRGVDLTGLEVRSDSRTFRWTGTYHDNMDERDTNDLQLNVLAEAPPQVPDAFKDSRFVFLANTHPGLQIELLDQLKGPMFVAADTMNCWIENNRDELVTLLKRVHCVIINEDEAKLFAQESNLVKAAKKLLSTGVRTALVKRGAAGSMMCTDNGEIFLLPAFPAETVVDPTGAGDSFAGGFMGYLAQADKVDFKHLKTAIAYGTVTASFTIADFSLNGLTSATCKGLDQRLSRLRRLTEF